jgi:hypothetical protein
VDLKLTGHQPTVRGEFPIYPQIFLFFLSLTRTIKPVHEHNTPTVLDVAKALFQTETSPLLERETPRLNSESLVFMKRWKDSASKKAAFEYCSKRFDDFDL